MDSVTVAVFVDPTKTFPKESDEADKVAVGVEGYTIAGPVKSSRYKDNASTETD